MHSLESEWGLNNPNIDPVVLPKLQPALTQGARRLTVAVYKNRSIMAVWPGLYQRAYGVAVDVGSTTVAAHLCNLSDGGVVASDSLMNPQILLVKTCP